MFSFFVADRELAALQQRGGNPDMPMELQPIHDTPATRTTETITQVQSN